MIYDLFDLNETPSPYKTCHHIARIMNSDLDSPFYRRLKMLEKREDRLETISHTIIQLKRLNNPCRYDIIVVVMWNEKVYFYKRGSARNQGCQRKEPG